MSPSSLSPNRPRNPDRRAFLGSATGLALGGLCRNLLADPVPRPIYGQGDFRYELVPDWGVLDAEKTPIKNGSAIICTRDQHLVFLTDEVKNNVLVYDTAGRLQSKWGSEYPGAHGLSLVEEDGREVLYLTDLNRNAVFKTTLEGELLQEWVAPVFAPQYSEAKEYRPSWTLHLPEGGFVVLDGYGKDYFAHYDAEGNFVRFTGGKEGGILHWGPHGGLPDPMGTGLLIAMSDQQNLLRVDLDGKILEQIDLPGSNPRNVEVDEGHYYIPHLADNWPADRKSLGYLSVLDRDLRVVSNVAGTAPLYDDEGKLQKMTTTDPIFLHPHDLAVDGEGSLYVAQFASNQTYPLKLVRV